MTPTHRWRPPILTHGFPIASITAREADVLTGIAEGLTNAQIARRHHITEHTVKSHAKNLYAALGAIDRAHCVALTASGQVVVHVRGESS